MVGYHALHDAHATRFHDAICCLDLQQAVPPERDRRAARVGRGDDAVVPGRVAPSERLARRWWARQPWAGTGAQAIEQARRGIRAARAPLMGAAGRP
eukprot:scaffold21958_cov66-Phaeocystis_antarctica.AAC.3